MATFTKLPLTGASNGLPILIIDTSSPGTTIHTAVTGTTDLDEIWLWVINNHTVAVDMGIEFGGTSDPLNVIRFSVDFKQGLFLVVPGLLLQNSLEVKAFTSVASVVSVHGFVNRISP